MIKAKCKNCGTDLESPSSLIGQQDQCPVCKSYFIVQESKTSRSRTFKALFILGGIFLVLGISIIFYRVAKTSGVKEGEIKMLKGLNTYIKALDGISKKQSFENKRATQEPIHNIQMNRNIKRLNQNIKEYRQKQRERKFPTQEALVKAWLQMLPILTSKFPDLGAYANSGFGSTGYFMRLQKTEQYFAKLLYGMEKVDLAGCPEDFIANYHEALRCLRTLKTSVSNCIREPSKTFIYLATYAQMTKPLHQALTEMEIISKNYGVNFDELITELYKQGQEITPKSKRVQF